MCYDNKMKTVEFNNKPLFLAPMAGVTDVGFRAVCSFFGADVTVTEMLSARAMQHNPQKTKFLTLTSDAEKFKIAQIFGHEKDFMVQAIQNPLIEKFDGIDINMGCPAPKIIKNGEGSALMDNLPLASQIIMECRKVTERPLSVKFRKGSKSENFLEFARMCQDSGADFVTFHARTAEQGYSGHVDLEATAQVKAKLKIPIVGNGDVSDLESLKKMWQTGVDGVMVGRASRGKPWVFAQLKDVKAKFKPIDIVKKHISNLREHFDEKWIKLYIRKHLLWYASSLDLSASLRLKLATCEDVNNCIKILQTAFDKID